MEHLVLPSRHFISHNILNKLSIHILGKKNIFFFRKKSNTSHF